MYTEKMRTCHWVEPTGCGVPNLANSYSPSKTPHQRSLLFTITVTDSLLCQVECIAPLLLFLLFLNPIL